MPWAKQEAEKEGQVHRMPWAKREAGKEALLEAIGGQVSPSEPVSPSQPLAPL